MTCLEPNAAKRGRDTTPQPGARRTAAGEWAQRDGVVIRAARDGQAVVRFIAMRDAATHARTRSVTAWTMRLANRRTKRTA
ncbi:hypothetical protein CFB52_015550 [Burkholderia sp. AU18528]|nr:hypothetical protein WS85_13435 [Burkholderia anthina]KVH14891.1 hypothetical protein WS84_06130 [Burkholderia anthina]KVN59180.1 hypothetical protein WT13_19565 [Burkholderia anthina]KVX40154.1 hypothetical protein WT32_05805 [Burkholderia anthina]PHP88856.1 hypothetical protein CFB52_015550 [Burkholderia sp. AU18528]